jgi:hypothetical protein
LVEDQGATKKGVCDRRYYRGQRKPKTIRTLLLGAYENGELLGELQFSSPLRNKGSNIHSNQNKRQTDDNWTHLKHFSMGLTTRLQFSYEQTACECSKTRKILQTNGQKHPTKTSRLAQPGQGVLRTTCGRGSLDGRPRSRGKEEVMSGTWIIFGRKSAIKPGPTIGSSGYAGPAIARRNRLPFSS